MDTQKKPLFTLPGSSLPRALTERAPDNLHRLNNALSQVELTDVRNRIAEVSSKVAELRSGMEQLDVLRSEYENSHDQCVAFIEEHQYLLSSIRSVPPEIWREVFLYVQRHHDTWNGWRPSLPFYLNAPQLFGYGAVSALWRRVTLDTPALWSTIHIVEKFSPSAILLLDHWLSRSKNHPLKIVINAFSLDKDSYDRFCDVRCLLNSQARRWLKIHISGDWDIIQDWPTITDQAPLLEDCYFHLDAWDLDETSSSEPASFITDAPKLRSVQVDHLQIGEFERFPPLVPWSSVKSLKLIKAFLYNEVDQLWYLKNCPSLEKFEMTQVDEDEDPLGDYDPFEHGNLKSLSISGVPRLLAFLVAPSLTSLRLDSFSLFDQSAFISEFVKRSPCLTDLTIDGGHDIIVPRLQGEKVSQIKSLTLGGRCADWANISKCLFALRSTTILPGLESLTVAIHCRKGPEDINTAKDALSVRDAVLTLCRARLKATLASASTLNQIKKITIKLEVSQRDLDRDKFKVETDAFRGLKDTTLEGLFVDVVFDG